MSNRLIGFKSVFVILMTIANQDFVTNLIPIVVVGIRFDPTLLCYIGFLRVMTQCGHQFLLYLSTMMTNRIGMTVFEGSKLASTQTHSSNSAATTGVD